MDNDNRCELPVRLAFEELFGKAESLLYSALSSIGTPVTLNSVLTEGIFKKCLRGWYR